MIKADFKKIGDRYIGFTVTGHSGSAQYGKDIICAGVSSAIMLTVNTITDFIKAQASVDISPEKEGYASLMLSSPVSDEASLMIESLEAHLSILKEQYGHISVRESCND